MNIVQCNISRMTIRTFGIKLIEESKSFSTQINMEFYHPLCLLWDIHTPPIRRNIKLTLFGRSVCWTDEWWQLLQTPMISESRTVLYLPISDSHDITVGIPVDDKLSSLDIMEIIYEFYGSATVRPYRNISVRNGDLLKRVRYLHSIECYQKGYDVILN